MRIMESNQASKWTWMAFDEAVEILDFLRKPINSKERAQRILGKNKDELYPYYGATGQVGYIDSYLSDGEYVLLGEDGAPFLDCFADKAYLIKGKSWVNNHAHILKSKYNNKFLCYYLNCFDYHGFVTGTTRYKLTQAAMKRIPVPVPDPDEQARIVSKIEELFSKLDASVAELQTAKEKLKVYRQAVYSSVYDKMRDLRPITEFFDITGGLTKNSKRNELPFQMPYLRVANVYYDYLDLSEIKEIGVTEQEIDRCLLKKGDLLFVEGNGSKAQIGRVAIWNGQISKCLHQNHIVKGRPLGNMLSEYALYYLISNEGRKQIVNVAKSTSGLYTLSTNKIKGLKVPYCDLNDQKRLLDDIKEKLSVYDGIEQTVNTSLQQAEALRQSILKQAFEGKI